MNQQSKHFKGRSAVSIVLSFLFSIFISVFALLLICLATLLNPGYLTSHIQGSEYSQYRAEELKEIFISYGMASNFDEKIMSSLIDPTQVQKDILANAQAIYKGQEEAVSASHEQEFYDKLAQNVSDRDISMTEENKQAVRELAKLCAEAYETEVSLPAASQVSNILGKIKLPVWIALGVDAVLMVFTGWYLFHLYRRRYRSIAYLIYALSGSALLIGLPGLVVLLSGRIARLGIINQALYSLITDYIYGVLSGLLWSAGVLLAISIILYFVWRAVRKKFIANSQEYRLKSNAPKEY